MRTTFSASTCFRAASSLDATRRALVEAAKDLALSPDEAGRLAAEALRAAEAEVMKARRALQAAATGASPLQLL